MRWSLPPATVATVHHLVFGRLQAWSDSIGYNFMFFRAKLRTAAYNEGPIIFHPTKSHTHCTHIYFFLLPAWGLGVSYWFSNAARFYRMTYMLLRPSLKSNIYPFLSKKPQLTSYLPILPVKKFSTVKDI
jgi:hypothetical protein